MTSPTYADDWLTLYGGDCRDVLASLPSDSVDCVVTSPPYWGLRDYGTDGQFGLERTPEEYVANMVAVFREVRRVLKPSGTCWLNLGDSYAGSGKGAFGTTEARDAYRPKVKETYVPTRAESPLAGNTPDGLKPKDLVGIPWRVAFALQADGWYLRSDIIWSKPNPMPESVTDRPTKSHEYLFLLTKSARYYFDADAVRESAIGQTHHDLTGPGYRAPGQTQQTGNRERMRPEIELPEGRTEVGAVTGRGSAGRNIRSVWTIATRPYPGSHFAVFPPELPERCIKAGSSEKGVCPECGAPWERVVERTPMVIPDRQRAARVGVEATTKVNDGERRRAMNGQVWAETAKSITTGWRPTCAHTSEPIPAVVLDPFGGSGTVGMVANRLSRRAILIDLNPEYLKQQMKRNVQTPLGLVL